MNYVNLVWNTVLNLFIPIMKSCLVDWEYLRFAHFRRAAVTAGEVSAAAQAGGQVQR